MSEDLKQACDRLTYDEKVELRNYLSSVIASTKGWWKSPLRCSILMGEMAKVIGQKTISYLSREPMDVWARTMIAYQMLIEGYSTGEIGRQMMKDHSTIIYLRKKMEDVFAIPQAYRDIIDIWNNFQNRIQA